MTHSKPYNNKYLHVIHHEFIAKLAPVLRVSDFLKHEAVHNGDTAVSTEGQGNLLIKVTEVVTVQLVAELSHPYHFLLVFNWKTQNVPVSKVRGNSQAILV